MYTLTINSNQGSSLNCPSSHTKQGHCNITGCVGAIWMCGRMSGHKTSSKDPDSAAEVGAHLNRCGGGFWKLPLFKVKVENKIARLVVEHKLIKMLKPDLNRDTRNLLHLTVGAGNE